MSRRVVRIESTAEQLEDALADAPVRWLYAKPWWDAGHDDWEARIPPHAAIRALVQEVHALSACLKRERADNATLNGRVAELESAIRVVGLDVLAAQIAGELAL